MANFRKVTFKGSEYMMMDAKNAGPFMVLLVLLTGIDPMYTPDQIKDDNLVNPECLSWAVLCSDDQVWRNQEQIGVASDIIGYFEPSESAVAND